MKTASSVEKEARFWSRVFVATLFVLFAVSLTIAVTLVTLKDGEVIYGLEWDSGWATTQAEDGLVRFAIRDSEMEVGPDGETIVRITPALAGALGANLQRSAYDTGDYPPPPRHPTSRRE